MRRRAGSYGSGVDLRRQSTANNGSSLVHGSSNEDLNNNGRASATSRLVTASDSTLSEQDKKDLLTTGTKHPRHLSGQKPGVTGVVVVQLFYDKSANTLRIHVDKARGLRVKGGTQTNSSQAPSAFVTTWLTSHTKKELKKEWKLKTLIAANRSADPVFAQNLTYENVPPEDELMDSSIVLVVFAMHTWHKEFLGKATIPLREGLPHCNTNGALEARLLSHDDTTPWHPTNVKSTPHGRSEDTSAVSSATSLEPPPNARNSPPSSKSSERTTPTASAKTPPPADTIHVHKRQKERPKSWYDSDSEESASIGRPTSAPTQGDPEHPHSSPFQMNYRALTDGQIPQQHMRGGMLSPLSQLQQTHYSPTPTNADSPNQQFSISAVEMPAHRPAAPLTTGLSYHLHCKFEGITDCPVVGESKDRYLTLAVIVEGRKDKTGNIECALVDENGEVPLENLPEDTHIALVVPFTLKLKKKRVMPSIQLRLSHGRPFLKQEVGHATIPLSYIPVYLNQEQATIGVDKQPPVDIILFKPKTKALPQGVRSRKKHVCMLKVKMWLTTLNQVIEEDELDGDAELFDDGAIADIDDEIDDPPPDLPEPLDWGLVDVVLQCGLHNCNQLLFNETSIFFKSFCDARNYTEVTIEPWSDENKRNVSYVQPKTSLVKALRATEQQEYVVKAAGAHVITFKTTTPDAPYGSTFETWVQFKLTPDTNKKHTRLQVTAKMNWLGNPFMKRIISSAAKTGLGATYDSYVRHLTDFIAERKTTVKRDRNISGSHDDEDMGAAKAPPKATTKTIGVTHTRPKHTNTWFPSFTTISRWMLMVVFIGIMHMILLMLVVSKLNQIQLGITKLVELKAEEQAHIYQNKYFHQIYKKE